MKPSLSWLDELIDSGWTLSVNREYRLYVASIKCIDNEGKPHELKADGTSIREAIDRLEYVVFAGMSKSTML